MLLSEKENKVKIHKNKESKLPFAVFISPNNKEGKKQEDYKIIDQILELNKKGIS